MHDTLLIPLANYLDLRKNILKFSVLGSQFSVLSSSSQFSVEKKSKLKRSKNKLELNFMKIEANADGQKSEFG